ncbi:MAG: xanthine dehydrogenase family protein subunit M [Candidatus Binatia bacterium]|jgi:carbon-monoxide dehydrogenase medium subunit|nr:xanthine dehydrogenase family protein subunit M [Candidatus Binatia bacterium]
MKDFEYLEPATVPEACALLKRAAGEARVFAGGTQLTIVMKQGLLQPRTLVNIKKIGELRGINLDSAQSLIIGGLVTHREIETSELLREKLPVLCDLEREVANIRVRNMATVGGNLASGEPLTDLPCVLISLDSKVNITGCAGEREIPLDELFVDYYQTVLAEDEILTRVVVPLPPAHTGVDYIRFSSSSVVDKPCVGVAARVSVDPQSRICRTVRIGLGCVAPTPMRAREAEKIIEGKELVSEELERVARSAAGECTPLSDLRGSEHYKREIVRALVKRAVPRAYEKAMIR